MKKIILAIFSVVTVLIILIYISVSSTSETFETCEIVGKEDAESIDFTKFKKVKVSASSLYNSNFIKNLLQGENYREAWSTPVTVPIVYLDTMYGGMEILKEGGGKQTHSLRLKAKNGIVYTLRSINKNPEKLIPEVADKLGLENIIIDGISSQHPYAAPVVAKLANAVNVIHTNPQVYFVPKQTTLNTYNKKYGNRLYLLEYESEGPKNWTNLNNISEILDTEDLQEMKVENFDNLHINKEALVRARLFDLVIGDWDRHAKQWGWAIEQKDSTYLAHPVAADRDNAFFSIDGLIPNLIANKNVIAELQSFEENIDYMDGLVYDFDVYFLKNTNPEVFINQAKFIQQNLTDEVIENALRYWNDELYDLYAKDISKKIKSRRDNLVEFAKRFSTVINNKPLIQDALKGSDKDDVDPRIMNCFECWNEKATYD